MNEEPVWMQILFEMAVPREMQETCCVHESLFDFVRSIASRQLLAPTYGAAGDLRSSQIIALAVETWRIVNGPNAVTYERKANPPAGA